MSPRNIHRKHFLLSTGIAIAGILGLRKASNGAFPASKPEVTRLEAGDRIRRDPRSIPSRRDVV